MEKIWLKHYPKGVPAEINMNSYRSLVDLFERSCQEHAEHAAFSNFGVKITYRELDEMTEKFAAYLENVCQLKKGDRVAIMMPNLLQYPVAMLGALRAGMIVVNVNPLYTASELTHILNDSGAKAIVIIANFAHVLEKALPDVKVKNIIITQLADLFPPVKRVLMNFAVKYIKRMVPKYHIPQAVDFLTVLAEDAKHRFKKIDLNHDDVAFLQYTGGTTGVAKGAILSHGNLIANVLQLKAWLDPVLGDQEEEIIITALPLYHIFSLTVNCLLYLTRKAENVLITNPRDIPHFIKVLKKTPFTAITGVNTLYNALLNNPKINEVDFSNLRFSIGGGMAVQRTVAERWQKLSGCTLIEGYGLTEASPVVTANPLTNSEYTGSIGLPLPSTNISIRDEESKELGIDEVGELCVRGPQVMRGYWQSGDLTERAFTADGWLRTGDMVRIDENGFVFIVDRKKDMIIVSGFNVYPNEVEDIIAKMPEVMEVAVVGIPQNANGEVVKAFVVKKDNSLTEEKIIEHCNQFLTRYKIPKLIEFRTELPKTNVGKILRRALRDEAKK